MNSKLTQVNPAPDASPPAVASPSEYLTVSCGGRIAPDRLGDAIRAIARGGKVGEPVQFALREGDGAAIFELRLVRMAKVYVPHGHGAMRRVGGVLCIDVD